MMNRKLILAIAVLFVLALASRWLLIMNQPPKSAGRNAIDLRFDYALKDFQLEMFDEEGILEARLQSPEIKQIATNQTSRIESPTLVLPRKDGGFVELVSNHAEISDDHNRIAFSGQVRMRHTAADRAPLRLAADDLELDIAARLVGTNGPVRVVKPGMDLTGRGLRADLENESYRLLGQVNGRYEQP